MKLINKKAIVTGASQGIGKGIALALAKAGADIVVHYRAEKEKAVAVANEIQSIGRNAFIIQADFTEQDAPEKFIETAIKQLGTIDILVNCAAVYERASFLEVKYETFAWMQKVNVEVPLRLIQCMARHLIKIKSPGSIINISSISGLRPSIRSCLNSCSKAGLNMLTASAALELAPYRIRVNGIAPGATDTESNQSYIEQDPKAWRATIEKIPLGRAGHLDDYAGLAVLLASDDSDWLTGVTIPCDGGTTISY